MTDAVPPAVGLAVAAATHAAILGQLAEGVIVADAGGRIQLVNPAAAAIHGVARLDVAPDAYAETYHLFTEAGDPYPPLDLPLARAVRGEVVVGARWRIRRPDGAEVFAVGNAQPLRDTAGAQIGAVLTLRDDTARETAEQALRALNAELARRVDERTAQAEAAQAQAERASAAKSDFLASMSHEIRTPLNGVVAVADMLARADLPEPERGMAELIRASGDTLQRLLSDILDMARIESGKIAIERAPFHLGDMLRAVAGLTRLACDEKGVRLRVAIAPELEGQVAGDMVRVRQVVTNLLSNAAKFTDRGEVALDAGRRPDGRVQVTVSDTGVGFDMADHDRLLQRFTQADGSITRRFGGSGLGLAICADLLALMGGRMEVDSAPGEGSRFRVDFDLPPCDAPPVASPAAPAPGASPPSPPLRVLLADDHPINRRVVQLMLQGGAAELTCVENGAEAVAAVEEAGFDMILMDMQMPVMDGLSALAEIRALERAHHRAPTPAIMLTANALPQHLAAAAQAGADLHLAKPFTAATLLGAMDAVIRDASQRPVRREAGGAAQPG